MCGIDPSEISKADVLGDPNHFEFSKLSLEIQIQLEPFTQRILSGPEPARRGFANHCNMRAIQSFSLRKDPSAQQRDPKRVEVSIRCVTGESPTARFGFGIAGSLNDNWRRSSTQKRHGAERRALDFRQGLKPVHQTQLHGDALGEIAAEFP